MTEQHKDDRSLIPLQNDLPVKPEQSTLDKLRTRAGQWLDRLKQPHPILVVILVLILVGGILWLFNRRQIANQQIALLVIQATTTAEWRATATYETAARQSTATNESRLALAATGTVMMAETSVARTATIERRATGTAEQAAVLAIATTSTSEQRATATAAQIATLEAEAALATAQAKTATAVQIATLDAEATFMAEQAKTATAATIATAENQNTATAQARATSTAMRVATQSALATSETQRRATATAEMAATRQAQATAASIAATATTQARFTPTPTPAPKINILMLACDTGFDVLNARGKVTNAWVTVSNVGQVEATDLFVTLSSQDEEAKHPDKNRFVQFLPPNHQVTFKLTVDTQIGVTSIVEVEVTTGQGITERNSLSGCTTLDENAKKLIRDAGELGQVILLKGVGF